MSGAVAHDETVPRYFTRAPSSPETEERSTGDPSRVAYVQDILRLGSAETSDREWIVAVDLDGSLDLVAVEDREALPGEAQRGLAQHEVSSGARVRHVNARELFLFAVELVEQPADTPGLNDLVYLYGRLTGPFPRVPGTALPASNGQLAATRADILEGLVRAAPYAFCHPIPFGARSAPRSFHMMLPGGRVEDIEAGRSIVLAYPMLSTEISTLDAGNEALTVQILHDLLRALEDDRSRAGHPPLPRRVPVPSRVAYAAQLEAAGWHVKGDRATRMPTPRNAMGALIARVFYRETVDLPPEGTTADFFAVARLALESLEWPDERSRVLHGRCRASTAGPRAVPAPAPASPAVPPRPAPLPPRVQRPRRDDWMKDFIGAHAKTKGTPPRITSSRVTSSSSLSPSPKSVDWRRDFETVKEPGESREDQRPAEPDWMKDFEGSDRQGSPSRRQR